MDNFGREDRFVISKRLFPELINIVRNLLTGASVAGRQPFWALPISPNRGISLSLQLKPKSYIVGATLAVA